MSSVESDGERSQRHIATELGIALGLVNAYLKLCIKKGLVKVRHVSTRRYACYPTSQGFAKNPASRFNICQIPSRSSERPRAIARAFSSLQRRTASIALCWPDNPTLPRSRSSVRCVTIVAVVDPDRSNTRLVGVEVCNAFVDVKSEFDAVVVTDVARAKASFDAATAAVGAGHVLALTLLGLRLPGRTTADVA